MAKFKILNSAWGELDLITVLTEDSFDFSEPGDVSPAFSVIAFTSTAGCKGVRFFKVKSDSAGMDDYFDRSLFGVCSHYGSICVELFFIRILFA